MTIQEQIVEMMDNAEFNVKSRKDPEAFYSKQAILDVLDRVDTTDPETGKEFLKKFKELRKRIVMSKDNSRRYAYHKVLDFYYDCRRDLGTF